MCCVFVGGWMYVSGCGWVWVNVLCVCRWVDVGRGTEVRTPS